MRSSKSRSRNKNINRNRQSGHNLNRVFDSSGPEGKVRGTPQQIIEKYSQLARDATLDDDRVAAENFMQHSEHYTRMHAEAQREIDARREVQEREHRERQQARADQSRNDPNHTAQHDTDQPGADHDQGAQPQPQPQPVSQVAPAPAPAPSSSEQPNFEPPVAVDGDSGLVETPEQSPARTRRRKPKTAPVADAQVDVPTDGAKAES